MVELVGLGRFGFGQFALGVAVFESVEAPNEPEVDFADSDS